MEAIEVMETINLQDLPISEYMRLYAALSNERRIQILFALYHNPASEVFMLSFIRLKKLLKISSAALSYHLKLLQDAGLLQNSLVRKENTVSQYHLTEKGLRLVGTLMKDLEAKEEQRNVPVALSDLNEAPRRKTI